jgi:hypothetical protein
MFPAELHRVVLSVGLANHSSEHFFIENLVFNYQIIVRNVRNV